MRRCQIPPCRKIQEKPAFQVMLTAIASLLALASHLEGAQRYWVTPSGGSFAAVTNWAASEGGSGGVSVPGNLDAANFTLNNTYETYLPGNVTNQSISVDAGTVTLNLNSHNYTLTQP